MCQCLREEQEQRQRFGRRPDRNKPVAEMKTGGVGNLPVLLSPNELLANESAKARKHLNRYGNKGIS